MLINTIYYYDFKWELKFVIEDPINYKDYGGFTRIHKKIE